MNAASRYQPARRHARIASGLLGAVIGLGVVASVIQGMEARSGGQSLGQFVATQRAVAAPMARAPLAAPLAPSAQPAAAAPGAV